MQNTNTNKNTYNIKFQIRKHLSYNFKSIQIQTLKHAIAILNKQMHNIQSKSLLTIYTRKLITITIQYNKQTHYYNCMLCV